MVEAQRKITVKTWFSLFLSIANIANLVNLVLLGVNMHAPAAETQQRRLGNREPHLAWWSGSIQNLKSKIQNRLTRQ